MNLMSKHSLALHLLRIIFGSYFVVTLIVTCIQLTADYQHAKNDVEKELMAMNRTFGASLASSMWRFQGEVQKATLAGISNLPVVTGVKIEDPHGHLILALGNIIDNEGKELHIDPDVDIHRPLAKDFFNVPIGHRFPILYHDEHGIDHDIGSWTVYSSRHVVLSKVAYGFTLILVNSIIKTVILWFIFLYVFHRWLGIPITRLSRFVQGLDLNNINTQQSIELPGKRQDELHFLAEAINAMLASLRTHTVRNKILYEQLEQEKESLHSLNRSLELRITERTHDLAQANEQLRLLSMTDALTGIPNRRCFDQTLEQEWWRCAHHAKPLTVALLDVDWFKNYNDHYGHIAGDEILRQIAKVLQETAGKAGDSVARYGGEEFALISPNNNAESGLNIAHKIRMAIVAMDIPHALSSFGKITVSIGVASCVPSQQYNSANTLLEAADTALYQAKMAGRNEVKLAELPLSISHMKKDDAV